MSIPPIISPADRHSMDHAIVDGPRDAKRAPRATGLLEAEYAGLVFKQADDCASGIAEHPGYFGHRVNFVLQIHKTPF
jgi:hypothetical protein